MVITVSRELGSQGSYMAAEAAERLGFRFLDREILQRAAAAAGYPDERMVRNLAEQEEVPGFVERVIRALGSMSAVPAIPSATLREGASYAELADSMVSSALIAERDRERAAANYRELVRQVIQDYAEAGNVIIVGRGGQVILQNRRNALHVRVFASPEIRIRNLVSRENLDREVAEEEIQTSDRQRAHYLQRYHGVDWQDPSLYHLTINADHVPVAMGAMVIVEATRWLAKSLGESLPGA
jgi:cytidylate kinase